MFLRRAALLGMAALCLSGCAASPDSGAARDAAAGSADAATKLHIVTTIFPPYDFVKKIGGDAVEVVMLLKPGMESHSYEPTPADIRRIMNSDLFLYAGGESDAWVEELLEGGDGRVNAMALLDWVEPLEEEISESMLVRDRREQEAGDADGMFSKPESASEGSEDFAQDGAVRLEEGEYDEHVWTSPRNAMVLTEEICAVMAGLDPGHAELFSQNADAYLEQLRALDAAFVEVTAQAGQKPLIFGDRFPLLYFVKTYGLEYDAAFPGCSMETEPAAATVASLTDRVRNEGIPVVFYLELSNGKIAEAIAEAAGAKTAVFYAVHSVSAEDLADGEDYVSLMYRNVESLREALR